MNRGNRFSYSMFSIEEKKQNLKKYRRKRGWLLFSFATAQFWVMLYLTYIEMISKGISPYFYIPICTIGALVMSLGGAMFLLFIGGAYAALMPLERDILNPINYAQPLKANTRIAVLMPIYHEDPARVAGGMLAMMEELSAYPEAPQFEWFVLSDSRNEDIIIQEELIVFMIREKYPLFKIAYRNRISNIFAKVGNTSDFYRRWGKLYTYVIMLDADSIMPGESFITLARSMEGDENIGLIQSRFYEIEAITIFGMVSNFRFLIDNFLYTHYYNFFNPGRGFYMGHNAILRVEAFMKCCNLPVMKRNSFFPGGKLMSHDYYEGCLIMGGGYETWILPQIISFDQQLHNLTTFYIRERRWLVGAQDWFRLFMSSSLDTFGKITMFQRAIFYYAATVGLLTFLASYFGAAYIFQNPMKARFFIEVFKLASHRTGIHIIIFLGSILLLKSFYQMSIYFIVLMKQKKIKKMGGCIKFFISYYTFALLQSFIMLIAMCLINLFIWAWLKRQPMVWSAQDREGTALSWYDCIKGYYKISLFGLVILHYANAHILPYMHIQQFRIMGMNIRSVQIPYLKFMLLLPALVLTFSPLFVRLTSISFSQLKKTGWLKTPYDREDQYNVVKNTFKYTEEMRKKIPENISFMTSFKYPWFALRHMANVPSRPDKFNFWKQKLENKNINELTVGEKKVVLRCRELWTLFFLKENNLN